ncbi:MAG TPA: RAMP superfamily CRISPR-associated protein [Verrucomicrobiota bacterium]|nr:RAMP superfamily CRISPR-associated protein [Verrucomicrobiota bacterium]
MRTHTATDPAKLLSSDCPLRFLARITLELETPLHIGTGQEWDESDAGVVLDPNGLPTIPLTSLIGVLREAFAKHTEDDNTTKELFGWQGSNNKGEGIGQGSRLSGSFGCIHDAANKPVYGLVPPERFKLSAELAATLSKRRMNGEEIPWQADDPDPVLAAALRPTLRDHARHNECGVADRGEKSGGKFDELVVCTGHRFTFELELIGRRGTDEAHWDDLFLLLANPLTRVGGKSRRGLGRFRILRVLRRTFDLASGDFEDYADYDARLDVPIPASEIEPRKWEEHSPKVTAPPCITITLMPRFFWIFGTGEDIEGDSDRAPVRDQRIVWTNDVPDLRSNVLYLPGSGMKGALRHRAWFHAQAKFGHFADAPNEDGLKNALTLITGLFGNESDAKRAQLQPGILYPDDQFELVDAPVADLQYHNSIDRFTASARDHLLFDEKPLWRSGKEKVVTAAAQPGLQFTLQLRRTLEPSEAEVLTKCLDDLIHARLAIGGGSGRGNGFCDGRYESRADGVTTENSLGAVTRTPTPAGAP